MNYKQKQELNQDLRNSFHPNYPQGCVKITSGETIKHALVKTGVCHWLLKSGYKIWTESRLSDGSRPDIICIKGHIGYIIEVLHSETEKKFFAKMEKSYKNFVVIPVRTDEFDYDTFVI